MVNFPPNYPSDPPLVQVDMGCVSPMELNLQCGLIDSSGRIRHPYLDDWSTGIVCGICWLADAYSNFAARL